MNVNQKIIRTPLLDFTDFEGTLESGRFSCRLVPRCETIRFLLSGRGMGNPTGSVAFGKNAESFTFMGVMSPCGGILISTPVPLPEAAKISVEGDRLTVDASAAVTVRFSRQGLLPLLQAYGRKHRRPRLAKPIFGWNSWDGYSTGVSEEDILANLEFIAGDQELKQKQKLTHIIVDDGWQTGWGHWLPNAKFPRGMAALAESIHQAGFKAGLWLAPLLVQPDTPLYRYRSHCLLKDRNGHPWLIGEGLTRSYYGLDLSVAESREFLHETFRNVREWGYDYIKLDFLFNHAQSLKYEGALAHDPAWSSSRHIVEMLKIAREELGDKVHIMGCNYPFELGGAGVDEARLTNDIAPFWLNVDRCYRAQSARFFMHHNWLPIDPDFTVVRVPETTWINGEIPFHVERTWHRNEEDRGWRKGPFWTESEMQFALALVILSGGSVILGDPLPQLNPKGLEYVRLALQHGGGRPAWPLDLDGVRPLPCIWRNDRLIAFMNPFETPLELTIPENLKLGADIFTGKVPPRRTVTVEPHACKLFTLKPEA